MKKRSLPSEHKRLLLLWERVIGAHHGYGLEVKVTRRRMTLSLAQVRRQVTSFPFIFAQIDPTALRVEWAKTKARVNRFEEEVVLLNEMRRVLQFCQWKRVWWEERGPIRQDCSRALPDGVEGPCGEVLSPELEEGLKAFAAEQGDMEDRISAAWSVKWAAAREAARPIIATVMGGDAAPPILGVDALLDSIIELDLRDDENDAEYPDVLE